MGVVLGCAAPAVLGGEEGAELHAGQALDDVARVDQVVRDGRGMAEEADAPPGEQARARAQDVQAGADGSHHRAYRTLS